MMSSKAAGNGYCGASLYWIERQRAPVSFESLETVGRQLEDPLRLSSESASPDNLLNPVEDRLVSSPVNVEDSHASRNIVHKVQGLGLLRDL